MNIMAEENDAVMAEVMNLMILTPLTMFLLISTLVYLTPVSLLKPSKVKL